MGLLRYMIVAAVVLCLPVAMAGQTFFNLGDVGAAYAKNDKSSGKGNSGKSKDNKSSSSKSDKSGKGSSKSKSAKSAKSTKQNKSAKSTRLNKNDTSARGPKAAFKKLRSVFKPKSKASASRKAPKGPVKPKAKVQTTRATSKPTKSAMVAAATAGVGLASATAHPSDLKALNSLNRNVNGLYNSSDPKMEPFREFIEASLHSDEALQDLEAAREALEMSQEDFDKVVEDLGLAADNPDDAQEEILDRAKDLLADEPSPDDPDYDAKYAAWTEELQELNAASETVERHSGEIADFEQARMDADEAQAAVSEEALREAIAASVNTTGQGPVTADDVSPEVEAWVATKLGVGDADGFIDEWPVETVEEIDEDDDVVSTPTEDPVEPGDLLLTKDEQLVSAATE